MQDVTCLCGVLNTPHLLACWTFLVPYLPDAGAWYCLLLYVPLYRRVRRGTAKQNIMTFLLWSALDLIIAGATYQEHGNYLMPLLFSFGGMAIIYAIRERGEWELTGREYAPAGLVVTSMAAWSLVSGDLATVLAAMGIGTAAAPQLLDTWREPETAPLDLYLLFLVGNALALASLTVGAPFTIEHHLFGATATAMTFAFIAIVLASRTVHSMRSQSA